MIVVDASVLAPAVLFDDATGARARTAIHGHEAIHAPQLVHAEVLSHVRRLVRSGTINTARGERALARALQLPMDTHPHEDLVPTAWRLRDRCSAYDALYVALAQILDATLLTADTRLARAVAGICRAQVVNSSA